VYKILLAGYYGFGNLGDDLLAATAAQLLSGRQYQTTILKRRSDFWRQIRKNDCLVFAGGSLFQDITGKGLSLLYYAALGFTAKVLGKKLFLVGQGIGPVIYPWDRLILRLLLKQADFISVRDADSAAFLRRLGCKNYQRGTDLLFAAKLKFSVKPHQKIAVNFRPFAEFKPEQGREILQNFATFPVPLQAGVDYGPALRPEAVYRAIASARLAVGMRLHFIILAILCNVPVIGIVYDPKVESLCRRFRLPFVTLDNLAALPALIAGELPRAARTKIRLKKLLVREQALARKSVKLWLEELPCCKS
jgi:polysaccharide pyruvyl transferase WcaK-like protein